MVEAKKIFVGNYKGGVGKTTSIYQIALQMVELRYRVLLIDLDPQCSLSEICLARKGLGLEQLEPNESLNYIYDMWQQFKQFKSLPFSIDATPLIKATEENVHFIPSNTFYPNGGLDELALKLKEDFEDLLPLQQFFQRSGVENEYDFILFDCPPSNNIITQGAFLLSNYYIIPSIIQTLSIRGVVHYIKTVENIYKRVCIDSQYALLAQTLFGKKPELLGIFETLKKGTVNNHHVLNDLIADLQESTFTTLLFTQTEKNFTFKTIIQNYEDIARSTAAGKKCSEYAELTDEIIACIGKHKGVLL
ncbi:ParA family protein [Halalkalibacter akibai]|uniref:Chromosome-partitioning ATPase n=1 Tax=Halalkalibacter akibai (strain ATCC 43226 / DSM 21942 / CIP 109018 / JCM 9157 / 1139) TaxID=1236973 RepID=W4QZK8_HALA3|nr:AAA family ATPase [Halalkalibacter akibai]GAE37103.1 chromosome-partitioning ATPase [Halalkalibacter akibai JCM 9157]